MNRFFRRLPLPVKLLLIGLIPFLFFIYTSLQVYREKKDKVDLLESYIERIHDFVSLNTLIDYLEKERKFSFDYAMRRDRLAELLSQRPRTDSVIRRLELGSFSGFTRYTFLENLQQIRSYIDSLYLPPEQVMHYYTTSIFRINTLNAVSPGSEIYLSAVYKDLAAQKILSDMITNLGIMRSNVYNALYTGRYMVETLVGMMGVHDVYKTYETEFLAKASSSTAGEYKRIRENTSLNPTTRYLDTLFKRLKPDSSYTADNWWNVSDDGMEQLIKLRRRLWNNIIAGTSTIIRAEKTSKERTLIFLVMALFFVVGVIVYAIYSITRSLREMKIAAQKISRGAASPPLRIDSADVIGNLAQSILAIDTTNKRLAEAADAIGKGNFDVEVKPRSPEDILGNAIVRMKDDLLKNVQVIQENNKELQRASEKLKLSHDQLRLLASHLQNIREDERTVMAREIHDELGQQITSIKMDVSWLVKKLATGNAQEQNKAESVLQLLDHTSQTVRKIATNLRPSILDDFGLLEALQWQSGEFEKRTGIKVHFHTSVPNVEIGKDITTALFRIYQESLTNVARHAAASAITVSVSLTDSQLFFTISDNGRGFDMASKRQTKTLGLLGMKERTLMVGGKYDISSVPGKGTIVKVVVPMQVNEMRDGISRDPLKLE